MHKLVDKLIDIIDTPPKSNKPPVDDKIIQVLYRYYISDQAVYHDKFIKICKSKHLENFTKDSLKYMSLFYSQIIHIINKENNYINKRLQHYGKVYKVNIDEIQLNDIISELYLVLYDFILVSRPTNLYVYVSDKLAMRLCSYLSKNERKIFKGNYKFKKYKHKNKLLFDNFTLSKRSVYKILENLSYPNFSF